MTPSEYVELRQVIVDQLAAGTYDGDPLRAIALTGKTEIRPPATAVVAWPRVTYEPLGEGFRIGATDWPIMLYTARGKEIDHEIDMAFLAAVEVALAADVTYDGFGVGVPTMAEDPTPETVAGRDGQDRQMLRRIITLHIDH